MNQNNKIIVGVLIVIVAVALGYMFFSPPAQPEGNPPQATSTGAPAPAAATSSPAAPTGAPATSTGAPQVTSTNAQATTTATTTQPAGVASGTPTPNR